jgi:NADPH:quinone reductase-like Zn-dependent oxidoreductase
MRQLCIMGPERSSTGLLNGTEGTFELEGVQVRYGIIETPDLSFDPDADKNADMVLLRVRAFSCNYRDRALILRMATSDHRANYYVIGSEFVGEIIATGRNVTAFEPGDRVIADAAYPSSSFPGVPPGLPTNHGSRELQIVHQRKLMRIPDSMPDDIAAGFSIGGQTTYSMIRRLDLQVGDAVLVTAAKSNTSLIAIAALKNQPVEVYGLSTSDRHANDLAALGLRELFVIDPSRPGWSNGPRLKARAAEVGGFDAVIDPFSDFHVAEIANVMATGGRLTSCGVADQHSRLVGKPSGIAALNPTHLMSMLLIKNISIIGNCLGQTSDLQAAVDDYCAGRLTVPICSRRGPRETGAFFSDTYLNKERFGKVIFRYDA